MSVRGEERGEGWIKVGVGFELWVLKIGEYLIFINNFRVFLVFVFLLINVNDRY